MGCQRILISQSIWILLGVSVIPQRTNRFSFNVRCNSGSLVSFRATYCASDSSPNRSRCGVCLRHSDSLDSHRMSAKRMNLHRSIRKGDKESSGSGQA